MQLFTVYGVRIGFFTIRNINLKSSSKIHSCSAICVGAKWRREQKIPQHGVEEGQIVDGFDWSYSDGKPALLNVGRKKRALLQIDICKKIIALTKEVDFIVEDFAKANQYEVQKKKRLLESKLKPKGDLLNARNNK